MKKRLLSMLLALCMVLTLLPISVLAADETSGTIYSTDISWKFDTDSGTLTLSGTGSMPSWGYSNNRPWESYIDNITHIVVGSGIKGVGTYAFYGCSNVNTVTLSDTVETIGDNAFLNCSNLQTIYIPASVNDINAPSAFSNCKSLQSISVSQDNSSYTSYGDGALYSKDLSVLLFVPGGISGTFDVPNGVQEIGGNALFRQENLSSVTLPGSVVKINSSAFHFSKISSVNIPEKVTEIGDSAFMYCDNLLKLEIPASVTSIGKWAFYATSNRPEREIYFYGNPPAFGSDCFNNATYTAYYPQNSLDWTEDIRLDYGGYITWVPWNPTTGEVETTYSVSYNLAGGSGDTPPTQNYKAGTTVTISSTIPTREGYTFTGWSDGTTTYQPGQTFTMPEQNVTITAQWKQASSSVDSILNDDAVFIKQASTKTCTLVTATMMVRRRAILDGISDWDTITEAAMKKVAWDENQGYIEGFTYRGITGGTESIRYFDTQENGLVKKKEYLISMLRQHPEGIGVYSYMSGTQRHAVLLTDYDATTDTFYCADPAGSSKGRIPLSQCTITWGGNGQNGVLSVLHRIYFVAKDVNRKTLVSSQISSHCPVEMVFSIGGTVLDSRTIIGTSENNFARMTVSGTNNDKSIEVQITGNYIDSYDTDVKLIGTDTGEMTFTVEHLFSDGSTEKNTFESVPITQDFTAETSGCYPQSSIVLSISDSINSTVWVANPDETATNPYTNFDDIGDDDTTITPTPPSSGSSNTPNSSSNSNSSSRGSGSVSSSTTTVNVSSTQNGSVSVSPKNAKTGDTVTITPKPNSGYEVDTVAVTGRDGEAITVTPSGSIYTFVMPSAKPVTVEVTFVKSATTSNNLLSDVVSGSYYYDAVRWAIENGITCGYADGTFRPNSTCTRAQIVTFLWRANGSPEPNSTANSFADVSADAYYAKAVQWAVEQGITTGTTPTSFSPDNSCTRAQAMTFLWRSNGSPATSGGSFSDVSSDKYYADAITWATANGVSTGYTDGTFAPDNSCTRAQIVTFLYRDRAS